MFFGGLLIAGRALGGFGYPSGCGPLGLDCLRNAIVWLFAAHSLAAALLWMAVPRLKARSGLRQCCTALAVLCSLVFAAGCCVIVNDWLEKPAGSSADNSADTGGLHWGPSHAALSIREAARGS